MAFRYVLDKNNELVTQASDLAVTASSESALVALNASELPVSKVWRAVTDAAEWIEFDLGSARSINFAAIVNTNVTATSATFRIRGGTTTAPSDFTQNLPAGQIVRTGSSWASFSSAQNYRYWRLEIDDPSNPDGYVQTGYVVLGTSVDWTFSYLRGWGPIRNRIARVAENLNGAPFVGPLIRKTTDVSFEFGSDESDALNATEADAVEAFLEQLEGGRQGLFFAPEGEDATSEGYFGRLVTPTWQRTNVVPGHAVVSEIVLAQDNPGVTTPL